MPLVSDGIYQVPKFLRFCPKIRFIQLTNKILRCIVSKKDDTLLNALLFCLIVRTYTEGQLKILVNFLCGKRAEDYLNDFFVIFAAFLMRIDSPFTYRKTLQKSSIETTLSRERNEE